MDTNEIRKYVTWGVVGLFAFALYSEFYFRKKPTPPRTFSDGQDTDVAITLDLHRRQGAVVRERRRAQQPPLRIFVEDRALEQAGSA